MQLLFQTCERLAFLFVTRKNQMKVGAKKKSKSSEYCERDTVTHGGIVNESGPITLLWAVWDVEEDVENK